MPTTLRIGGAEGGFQTRPYELGTPAVPVGDKKGERCYD